MTTTTDTILDPQRIPYRSHHPSVHGQSGTGYGAHVRLMPSDLPRLPHTGRLTAGQRGHYTDVYLSADALRKLAAEAIALADGLDEARRKGKA